MQAPLASSCYEIAIMQLKDIKRLYRLYMNGIVSHSMRQKGAGYRVNFGLTMPLLRRIAEQIPPSVEIAEALWGDTGVRESMLLAPMVYPHEQCDATVVARWVEQIPTVEVADFCCKYLFAHLNGAAAWAQEWVGSEHELVAYTGFRLACSQVAQVSDVAWLQQVAQCAIDRAAHGEGIAAHSAGSFLTEALLLQEQGKVVVEALSQAQHIDEAWRKQLASLYEEME